MNKSCTSKKKFSAISLGIAMFAACNMSQASTPVSPDALVECYGVAKQDPNLPVMMTKSMCDQLPFSKQELVTEKDYVQCYGVAASGKNGCATKTNSCGGKELTAKAPDAWTSLPASVCASLSNNVVNKG